MRLILTHQNATTAVSKTNFWHCRSRLTLQRYSTIPHTIKHLSLNLPLLVHWFDVRSIVQHCRDSIEDVFAGGIVRYRYECGFDQVYPYLREKKDILQLVGLVKKHISIGTTVLAIKSNIMNCFNLRDDDEVSYIVDTVRLEHNVADHYSHIHITAWGTAQAAAPSSRQE
jgi:hypothetical protein